MLKGNPQLLPAARKMKDVEALLDSPFEYIVLLGGHLGQLKSIVDLAKQHGKNILLHADLIDGLNNDEVCSRVSLPIYQTGWANLDKGKRSDVYEEE